MKFSYIVDKRPLLENINLDLSQNKIIVITGTENVAFEILGGVIAGLFPIEKEESFSQLEELVKYFSGDLILHDDSPPESGLYLGADPDRHILFSKVKEEVYAQLGFNVNVTGIIKKFALDESFKNRRILTLSGGEKVKLALSILFSKRADCIVLHGVLPWLDIHGKNILLNEIEKSLNDGINIIVLEQEMEYFKEQNSNFYYFDGITVKLIKKNEILNHKNTLLKMISKIKERFSLEDTKKEILSFKNIDFDYSFKENKKLLLKDISFTLYSSRIYGLIGENGSGKSTIAKLITRILTPLRGSIIFGKEELKSILRKDIITKISYVGQFPERQLVYGNVDQYRSNAKSLNNLISVELLNKFFNIDYSYPISVLTPLQLKLLLLFSSITSSTKLIILDEPTWGVDMEGQIKIAKVIDFLINNMNDLTLLLISHDRQFLNEFSTDLLLLSQGKVKKVKA